MTSRRQTPPPAPSIWDDPLLQQKEPVGPLSLAQPAHSATPTSAWDDVRLQETVAAPPLPPGDHAPTILIIDDEDEFNRLLKNQLLHYYPDRAILNTLNPTTEDPVEWMKRHLAAKKPLDAVYIDYHIPQEKYGNGCNVLNLLRDVPGARYIPMVLITAYLADTDDDELLRCGAQRFMYKPGAPAAGAYFLHQAILIVEQLRDQMEDQRWIDLNTDVGTWLAEGKPVKTILEMVVIRLRDFGTSACYIREVSNDPTDDSEEPSDLTQPGTDNYLIFKGGIDFFGVGSHMHLRDAPPFMMNLLKQESPLAFRHERLTPEDAGAVNCGPGSWHSKLVNQRVVAATILFASDRLGTITLYRTQEARPFRPKDASFLIHLAQQIGAGLGMERRDRVLRRRQTALTKFAKGISQSENEQDAIDMLGSFLHKELQGDDPNAITTIRLVDPTTGELQRLFLQGLPAREMRIHLTDIDKSVCAKVVHDGQSALYGDIKKDLGDSYIFINPEVNSILSVLMTASGHPLGAANLEHITLNHYTEDDKDFAKALCRTAATFLIHLRVRVFLSKLLNWIQRVSLPDSINKSEILPGAFRLLAEFTRFSYLLFLVPSQEEDPDTPWDLQLAFDQAGDPLTDDVFDRWQAHLRQNWPQTFLKQCLDNTSSAIKQGNIPCHQSLMPVGNNPPNNKDKTICLYSTDTVDTPDDAVGFHTVSMVQLQFISPEPAGRIQGVMELLFPVKNPLNDFERKNLEAFGELIASLWRQEGQIRRLYDEVAITTQERLLQERLSSFQHKIRTRLGIVGATVDDLRDIDCPELMDGLDAISDALTSIRQDEKNLGRLIKKVEVGSFSTRQVWRNVTKDIIYPAFRCNNSLQQADDVPDVTWASDREIVEDIIFNLVQNAFEHAEGCQDLYVKFIAEETDSEHLRLSVQDNGPGVPQHLRGELFKRGFSTKPHGTGYGLEFCRRRARDLGGDLIFSSVSPHGSSFELLLPSQMQR